MIASINDQDLSPNHNRPLRRDLRFRSINDQDLSPNHNLDLHVLQQGLSINDQDLSPNHNGLAPDEELIVV